MRQETIEYYDETEKLIGEFIVDDRAAAGEQPAILLFPAFEGRSEFALQYAKRLAEQGFAVMAADMYGNARTSRTIEGCMELVSPFLQDRSLVRKRALLAFKALCTRKAVNKNKIGAMGFCFGGMCALEIVRSGENLRAAVSAHGVLAESNLTTHPVKSKILILHGYQDPQVPPDSLTAFAQEMTEAGAEDWICTFFGDAKHAFTDPNTGSFDPVKEEKMGRVYNRTVAEYSFRYAVDFFKNTL